MPARRRMWAYPLATLASGGLALTLWLPWYSLKIPADALARAEALSSQFGILGPLVRQGAEYLRQLGSLHLTAWKALEQVDVALVLAAVIAGALALMSLLDRAAGVARVIAFAGGAAVILSGYRTLFPPGPSGVLHPAWGAYLAVCCSAVMLLAGMLAYAGEQAEDGWPLDAANPLPATAGEASVAWSTAGSVAPPGT